VYTHKDGVFSGSTVLLVPENDDSMGSMSMGGMDMGDMNMDMSGMDMDANMSDTDSHSHGHSTKVWGSGTLPTVNLTATPDSVSGYNF